MSSKTPCAQVAPKNHSISPETLAALVALRGDWLNHYELVHQLHALMSTVMTQVITAGVGNDQDHKEADRLTWLAGLMENLAARLAAEAEEIDGHVVTLTVALNEGEFQAAGSEATHEHA